MQQIIGLMQIIPSITNTSGQPTIYMPLIFIIIISMVKDLFEDLKRHNSDAEENGKMVYCFKKGKFVKTQWKNLMCGHIIKINKNESIPADLLLLNTSEPKGVCFIETKNLDGETNLKNKQTNKSILKRYQTNQDYDDSYGCLKYEQPNPYLYNFTGQYKILGSTETIPLDHQSFLLRGCSLRNTQWIVGLVTYTGHDTKIMLNSVNGRAKKSNLEIQMNFQIIMIFFFQLILCILSASISIAWFSQNKDSLKEIMMLDRGDEEDNNYFLMWLNTVGRWLLLFTNFVPISLLVTLEMVKFIQAIVISNDMNLYSAENDIKATVQSSNLNEELGQIQYIFSDKTGTLTCNIMQYKKISINGHSYGEVQDLKSISDKPLVTNVDFRDSQFFRDLDNTKGEMHEPIKNILFFLALCHNIIVEKKKDEIIYNASSPDELALVNFAKYAGVTFEGIDTDNNMIVKFKNNIYNYELVHVLEFNSTRKRMSVILKQKDGDYILYCKGADSIIFDRMDMSHPSIQDTQKNLDEYGKIGLRTLLLAQKRISAEQFNNWNVKYLDALSSMVDREKKVMDLQDEIETNLQLVGATAIEDKLQDQVGITISTLKDAGIKVWVLTGDKIETAINIAYSCQLLNDDLIQIQIDGKNDKEVERQIEDGIRQVQNAPELLFCLIVSGEALIYGMNSKELSKKLMELADLMNAVLCCRVSPKQKQEVVSLVRSEKPFVKTLAIGDGANDVNMITAAHVGIGIRGVEGQQAARASDYALGEFKLLKRLLLYTGRESYRKNCHLILYNFYKNVICVMPHFIYGFMNGFTGQLLYDEWLYQLYNLFFTAMPIIIYAIFDEEFPNSNYLELKNQPPNLLESMPIHYSIGLESKLFGTKQFWMWFLNATIHAVIISLVAVYSNQNPLENGRTSYLLISGMQMFSLAIFLANIKVFIFSNVNSNLSIFFNFGSQLLYIILLLIFNTFPTSKSFNIFSIMYGTANNWLAVILTLGLTVMSDIAINRYAGFKNSLFISKKIVSSGIELSIQKKKLSILEPTNQNKVNPTKVNNFTAKRRQTGYAFSQDEPITQLQRKQQY